MFDKPITKQILTDMSATQELRKRCDEYMDICATLSRENEKLKMAISECKDMSQLRRLQEQVK